MRRIKKDTKSSEAVGDCNEEEAADVEENAIDSKDPSPAPQSVPAVSRPADPPSIFPVQAQTSALQGLTGHPLGLTGNRTMQATALGNLGGFPGLASFQGAGLQVPPPATGFQLQGIQGIDLPEIQALTQRFPPELQSLLGQASSGGANQPKTDTAREASLDEQEDEEKADDDKADVGKEDEADIQGQQGPPGNSSGLTSYAPGVLPPLPGMMHAQAPVPSMIDNSLLLSFLQHQHQNHQQGTGSLPNNLNFLSSQLSGQLQAASQSGSQPDSSNNQQETKTI